MIGRIEELKKQFHRAIDIWLNPGCDRKAADYFVDLWLGPECAFLKYPHVKCYELDGDDHAKLKKLYSHNHWESADFFYSPYCTKPGDESWANQAAALMEGLCWGLRAALHLRSALGTSVRQPTVRGFPARCLELCTGLPAGLEAEG